jgi:hypothetical protein
VRGGRKSVGKSLRSCKGGAEAVADPGLGFDVAGAVGGIEFLAELGDEDAEVFGLIFAGGAPDLAEKEFVGEDAVGTVHEKQEEIEFFGSEVDLGAAHADSAAGRVDVEVADGDFGGCGLFVGGFTKVGADAGEEFGHAEGLGDVVVGALVERGDLHGFLLADGEDDDGGFSNAADGAGELDAAHFRHGEVGDDEVGRDGAEELEGFEAVICYGDFVAAALEGGAEDAGDLALVVDDEDTHG